MSKIELTTSENIQTFDVIMAGTNLSGEISNRTQEGDFQYRPDEFEGYLTASALRAVADELDRLNS